MKKEVANGKLGDEEDVKVTSLAFGKWKKILGGWSKEVNLLAAFFPLSFPPFLPPHSNEEDLSV